jgi:F420-0:gamma-glutamyl ligase
VPVAIVRGIDLDPADDTAQEYIRPKERDLFR